MARVGSQRHRKKNYCYYMEVDIPDSSEMLVMFLYARLHDVTPRRPLQNVIYLTD